MWRRATLLGHTPGGAASTTVTLSTVFKFLLSWVALAPISIIVSGKLLGQLFKLTGQGQQWFQVSIPGVIRLRASGAEAVLGFVLFICNLLLVGLTANSQRIDHLFTQDFGSNLGSANSLVVFCALLSVGVSALVLILTKLFSISRRKSDPILAEHDRLITGLAGVEQPQGSKEGG